jgi:hypothetical protein
VSKRAPRVSIAPGLQATPLLAHSWDVATSVKSGMPSGGGALALRHGELATLQVAARAARSARASWTAAVSGTVLVEVAEGSTSVTVPYVQVRELGVALCAVSGHVK